MIGPKNTNLIGDVEILLPVKFRRISFSGIRGEVKNVSANQRAERPSLVPNVPKTTNLVEDCFFSSFVEFRSEVSGKNSKMSQPIKGRAAILFFRSAQKIKTNVVEDVEILLPVKFS